MTPSGDLSSACARSSSSEDAPVGVRSRSEAVIRAPPLSRVAYSQKHGALMQRMPESRNRKKRPDEAAWPTGVQASETERAPSSPVPSNFQVRIVAPTRAPDGSAVTSGFRV